ncbi:DUF917 family protein [Thalassotalea sp. Y01]|nr:DUF917 family protein [Thalassotalea sp. Y01]
MAAYLNGKIDVTIPDLICCCDMDNNEPITNPNCHQGSNVRVVVLPVPKEFVTDKGLSTFGPAYLSLDIPYSAAVERYKAQQNG